jgi:GGDEF domain-containing protein
MEDAAAAALRLCRTVKAQSVQVSGHAIAYTVSAGVATMDAGFANIETLLER